MSLPRSNFSCPGCKKVSKTAAALAKHREKCQVRPAAGKVKSGSSASASKTSSAPGSKVTQVDRLISPETRIPVSFKCLTCAKTITYSSEKSISNHLRNCKKEKVKTPTKKVDEGLEDSDPDEEADQQEQGEAEAPNVGDAVAGPVVAYALTADDHQAFDMTNVPADVEDSVINKHITDKALLPKAAWLELRKDLAPLVFSKGPRSKFLIHVNDRNNQKFAIKAVDEHNQVKIYSLISHLRCRVGLQLHIFALHAGTVGSPPGYRALHKQVS
jgi:hypothetical protein